MNIAKNERGLALVLALMMLALLSILGAYALSTSSTEMFIAGNYKNTELAFAAADSGEEDGLNTVRLDSTATNTSFVVPVGANTANVSILRVAIGDRPIVGIKESVSSSAASLNKLTNTKESSNERGTSGSLNAAAYYVVHSIGHGPANARVDVESMVWLPAMDTATE